MADQSSRALHVSRAAADGAAQVTRFDVADAVDDFAGGFEGMRDGVGVGLADDGDHADAAVEGAGKLGGLDRAAGLEVGEQAREGPGVGVDDGVAALGQDARDIFEQPAAGDVGERADAALADDGEQALHVDARGGEEEVAEQMVLVEDGGAVELPAVGLDQLADEAEAVRMDPRAGESEDDVAGGDARAGEDAGALDRADAEAREVIIARRVHAGHFGGLAPDQRAARGAAALRRCWR